MAHGLNSLLKKSSSSLCKSEGKTGTGSRRIFAPHFKLQVLDSYRHDVDCKGNQRATARKYGIHRRQIQKWLQVENNLRNSVCKGKISDCVNLPESGSEVKKYGIEMALKIGRLQDASLAPHRHQQQRLQQHQHQASSDGGVKQSQSEARRVPAPSQLELEVKATSAPAPTPLDFTTHSRVQAIAASQCVSPIVAGDFSAISADSPIDLSFKRTAPGLPSPDTPVPAPRSPLTSSAATSRPSTTTPPSLTLLTVQPLPDVWDLSTKKKLHDVTCLSHGDSDKAVKLFKPYLDDFNCKDTSSTCSSASSFDDYSATPSCCPFPPATTPNFNSDYYYYNNNNNNNNNNNSPCEIKAECTYTIHELQPNGHLTCCLPYTSYQPHSDYETKNSYFCRGCDDTYYNLKTRQAYSVDFKLSAIDCYQENSVGKENGHLTNDKNLRHVQKWLRQEDELTQRNSFVKHTQLVR